jgi:hypothetical protein
MAMQIDTVQAEMDVLPAGPAAAGDAPAPALPASRAALKAMLRPVVLEILAEEMERLTRRYGR